MSKPRDSCFHEKILMVSSTEVSGRTLKTEFSTFCDFRDLRGTTSSAVCRRNRSKWEQSRP